MKRMPHGSVGRAFDRLAAFGRQAQLIRTGPGTDAERLARVEELRGELIAELRAMLVAAAAEGGPS
jgi:hypothetical protein